jgi:N6-L-threonylcarbamoyladenine synthase
VIILAIETSCDETGVALLEITGPRENIKIEVLSNCLYSQAKLHEAYGGVYPNLAKREHIKNLPILLEKVLVDSGIKHNESRIDLIAVTAGPGLEPALWTGITFAEELGRKWSKNVMPINHMEGHIWSVLYGERGKTSPSPELPALALLVSGGHTELVLVKDFDNFEILGRTRDDAVGEAFDKVARMLGLPYPGGPAVSELAAINRSESPNSAIEFPRPMLHSGNLDFSFSGLKTAVLYKLKTIPEPLSNEKQAEVARAFEDAAIAVLIEKTRQALSVHEGSVRSLIVAGGVAGNSYLKSKLSELIEGYSELKLYLPAPEVATDNAIMIGIAGYIRSLSTDTRNLDTIKANGNLSLDN